LLSVDAVNRAFSRRLSLNRAILKSPYWVLPVDDVGHNNYQPVGRGLRSSVVCGRWMSFSVCKNVEGHKGISLGGTDCTGKVVVRHNHMWCHKSSCPVCSSEMVRSVYVGKRHVVKDVGHADYVPWFADDEFDENGQPNYIDVGG